MDSTLSVEDSVRDSEIDASSSATKVDFEQDPEMQKLNAMLAAEEAKLNNHKVMNQNTLTANIEH